MKIRSVKLNNKRKMFEVNTSSRKYFFPFSKSVPAPTPADPVTQVRVDKEIGSEGFSYELMSGGTGRSISNRSWSTTTIPTICEISCFTN
jgi:hypothetical protein